MSDTPQTTEKHTLQTAERVGEERMRKKLVAMFAGTAWGEFGSGADIPKFVIKKIRKFKMES